MSKSLELVNVTLFGKRVCADVFKNLEIPLDSSGGPNSDHKCAYKSKTGTFETGEGKTRRRSHVMVETETGGMQPQAKAPWGPGAAGGGEESPSRAFEGSTAPLT